MNLVARSSDDLYLLVLTRPHRGAGEQVGEVRPANGIVPTLDPWARRCYSRQRRAACKKRLADLNRLLN